MNDIPFTPYQQSVLQCLQDINMARRFITQLVTDAIKDEPAIINGIINAVTPQLLASYLPLAGNVSMTGQFNLHADADLPLQPTTLQQVLTLLQSYVPPSNGGSVTPAVPEQFDRTLYQGTVVFNPTNDEGIGQYITLDNDVTWYAQWGKVVEFKFRATVAGSAQQSPAPVIANLVPMARLHGLGLFADDYHEILPAYGGSLSTDVDAESGGSVYPAVIRQVDATDWTQGYDFMLQRGLVVPPVGKDMYLRAATVLTSAMYFLNGECILDDPQYVQVG